MKLWIETNEGEKAKAELKTDALLLLLSIGLLIGFLVGKLSSI